jgi:hypothetical protein
MSSDVLGRCRCSSPWLRDVMQERYGARSEAFRYAVDHDTYRDLGGERDADHGDVEGVEEHRESGDEEDRPEAGSPTARGVCGGIERSGGSGVRFGECHVDQTTCPCIQCQRIR